MNLRPLFDMSWGPALAILGCYSFPLVAGWTVISEAVALYWLGIRASFFRCLRDAISANFVSGIFGIVAFFEFTSMPFMFWVNRLNGSPPIDTYQTIDSGTIRLAVWLLLAADWVGSIVLEGFVLMYLWRFEPEKTNRLGATDSIARRPSWSAMQGQVWTVSTIINTISYAGLTIAILFFHPV